jgi:predicted acylesterase/phospholipase RssA
MPLRSAPNVRDADLVRHRFEGRRGDCRAITDLEESSERSSGDALGGALMNPYCDLVMKGGITSGVIYPKLVAQLSDKYRFKNIGGTSAGAIAAGASAAAEHGRRMGNGKSFDSLANLPDYLSKKITAEGRTRLFTLFQPVPALSRHFAVLVSALNAKPGPGTKAIVTRMLLLRRYLLVVALAVGTLLLWPFVEAMSTGTSHVPSLMAALVSMLLVAGGLWLAAEGAARGHTGRAALALVATPVAVGAAVWVATRSTYYLHLLGVGVGMSVAALLVIALLVIAAAVLFARDLIRGVHANGYGLCSGLTQVPPEAGQPALTDWLTGYLNELAGRPPQGDPLTFGDLWGTIDPNAPREVNLEVMTTAVSQQMVYSIPFRPGTPRFYYDSREWERLFPASVMRWLDTARNREDGDAGEGLPEGSVVTSPDGKPLRALPQRADLPVVVAVRMSLSFPFLLSAVPLYSIDWSLKESAARKQRLRDLAPQERAGSPLKATRVWFSDGGIGSNMPLHMFDALLPGHPTFAVNLKAQHPDYPIPKEETDTNDGGRVYLPQTNQAGQIRHWPNPDDGASLAGLVGFFAGIVNTMQNWRDEILFPYPGFRDRIVQISQKRDEGGLNLDMPDASIKALAGAGKMAADRLVARFHPDGAQKGAGWDNHRVVRLGTFLGTMQPGATALNGTLGKGNWNAVVGLIKGYRPEEQHLAAHFLKRLAFLGALGLGGAPSLERGALKPLAQIRVTPRI